MRRTIGMLVGAVLATAGARASVQITEIMYHPFQGGEYEYIEIYNAGPAAEEIGGWELTDGVAYTFPGGTRIEAGAYLVVCQSLEAMRAAYAELPEEILLGPFQGALSNAGERVTLLDADRVVRETVVYDDAPPWETLADGFGPSLERICLTAGAGQPEAWRAGPFPEEPGAFGGSPGAPSAIEQCPPAVPERPRVLISEIMYHPVLEESLVEDHEFVEIWNGEDHEIDLEGWRIAGGIDFAFPAGAKIGPGEYRVIAKNRAALARVAAYGLREEEILGDYARELDNGGEPVALIGPDGQGIDAVRYDDDFPWPCAADALGAGPTWLPSDLLPLEGHRYLGYSLERVSFDRPAVEVANWALSPLDAPTPGRPNASAREEPLPIAEDVDVEPAAGGGPLIRKDDDVFVQVRFAPPGRVRAAELDSFVDDMERTDETVATVTLHDDGMSEGDREAGDDVFSAILPPRDDNSIVRYRIRADWGEGMRQIAPRPSDPYGWFAYFVSPAIDTPTRVYKVFISRRNWGRMWTNIQGGRTSGCSARASWNAKVPAVFVGNAGRVYDVHVRYQGSRWNRSNGAGVSRWSYPGPSAGPNPPPALSWRFSFPRCNQHEGRSVVVLNKLTQGCPGYTAYVGFQLYREADVPAPRTRFVRLYVNGGYLRYMLELERPGEEMMRGYHREMERKYPGLPREKVGHLFKSAGCTCDEGPYGWGDERLLNTYCGHPSVERYQYTYDRKTYEWDSHDAFIRLIGDLHAARRGGTAAMRRYFEENFDLDLLLNYMAIINYQVPFDDMFQNHFLYQRLSDGKWLIMPWDLDRNFGGWKGAGASLYMGEQGDRDNRSGWWNYLKDAFLKSYRTEFEDRLVLLNNTLLHPDHIGELVDWVTDPDNPDRAIPSEANLAASRGSCSFPGAASSFKSFAAQRYQIINRQLRGADAGPDRLAFVGEEIAFDASASRPDPGPGVAYTWSNGMEGERPTWVFDAPGVYEITLTIDGGSFQLSDDVTVTVLETPRRAYVQEGDLAAFEAEDFDENDGKGGTDTWFFVPIATEATGRGYMEAIAGSTYSRTGFARTSPELRYVVRFQEGGTWRIWIRGQAAGSSSDSCHVGVDLSEPDRYDYQRFSSGAGFAWSGRRRATSQPSVIDIPGAGVHILSIWIRESGLQIDKIVLARDLQYAPEGEGPPVSRRESLVGGATFIRGDANADGRIDLSDAIRILNYLFGDGAIGACLDRADTNDTGGIDLGDAIYLLAYLFIDGAEPPAPFPEPGPDPTDDELPCEAE